MLSGSTENPFDKREALKKKWLVAVLALGCVSLLSASILIFLPRVLKGLKVKNIIPVFFTSVITHYFLAIIGILLFISAVAISYGLYCDKNIQVESVLELIKALAEKDNPLLLEEIQIIRNCADTFLELFMNLNNLSSSEKKLTYQQCSELEGFTKVLMKYLYILNNSKKIAMSRQIYQQQKVIEKLMKVDLTSKQLVLLREFIQEFYSERHKEEFFSLKRLIGGALKNKMSTEVELLKNQIVSEVGSSYLDWDNVLVSLSLTNPIVSEESSSCSTANQSDLSSGMEFAENYKMFREFIDGCIQGIYNPGNNETDQSSLLEWQKEFIKFADLYSQEGKVSKETYIFIATLIVRLIRGERFVQHKKLDYRDICRIKSFINELKEKSADNEKEFIQKKCEKIENDLRDQFSDNVIVSDEELREMNLFMETAGSILGDIYKENSPTTNICSVYSSNYHGVV